MKKAKEVSESSTKQPRIKLKRKWMAQFSKTFVLVAAFGVIGTYFILQTGASPKLQPAVTLALTPSSARLQRGDTLSLAITLDTNGQDVNAVEASVAYPADKLEFVSIDGTGSAFEVEAPVSQSAGLVTIPRGHYSAVNGSGVHVATLNLRAIANTRKAQVKILDTSSVLKYGDSTNILSRVLGGQYVIQ
jgi:hypothetical protein